MKLHPLTIDISNADSIAIFNIIDVYSKTYIKSFDQKEEAEKFLKLVDEYIKMGCSLQQSISFSENHLKLQKQVFNMSDEVIFSVIRQIRFKDENDINGKTINGFIVYKNDGKGAIKSNKQWLVFHPIYDGTFWWDFDTIDEVYKFCTYDNFEEKARKIEEIDGMV